MSLSKRHPAWRAVFACLLIPTLTVAGESDLTIQTDAVGPQHFIAVHGRASLIQGYTGAGLELWTYPLQLVDGFKAAFRTAGSTSDVDADTLLRSVRYEPDGITRIYVGADFVVREHLFVPMDRPATVITYEVDSRKPIDVIVRFNPVLNLMWPGAIGGQATRYVDTASAYLLFEPSKTFAAFVGSPDIASHDTPVNNAMQTTAGKTIRFSMRAGGDAPHSVHVYAGTLDHADTDPAPAMKSLAAARPQLIDASHAYYTELPDHQLEVITPDADVNSALAWAGIALDQAWVCNPKLGCASVAGYGPSRDERRAQYEWFFAGDGLLAMDAMVATGRFDRARKELEFILRYQEPRTGLIWHELSQSASYLDWNNAYPYMYVHVDIGFQFLGSVARYVKASGDRQFVVDHWDALRKVFEYSRSLASGADGLPRIPPGKEGHNEQDRLSDDLPLSVSWLQASEDFAQLATWAGHPDEASEATAANQRIRRSIGARYWVAARGEWIDGFTESGKAVVGHDTNVLSLIDHGILTDAEDSHVLDTIAGADFQTDWGSRSVSSLSPTSDPSSYSKGSVWGLQTASVATTYWGAHRPATAFPIWRALTGWNRLDSPGHLHEVLAGDVYHQQYESVPEQTWSTAALLSSTAQGLLGLTVDAVGRRLTFAPHLPPTWNTLRARHIDVAGTLVDVSLSRDHGGLTLVAHNAGAPLPLHFAPAVPLGSAVRQATIDGRLVESHMDIHPQDTHAAIDLTLPTGDTTIRIAFSGGVELATLPVQPQPGDRSVAVKIIRWSYADEWATIEADVPAGRESTLLLRTDGTPSQPRNATISTMPDDVYALTFSAGAADPEREPGYRRVTARVHVSSGGPAPDGKPL